MLVFLEVPVFLIDIAISHFLTLDLQDTLFLLLSPFYSLQVQDIGITVITTNQISFFIDFPVHMENLMKALRWIR